MKQGFLRIVAMLFNTAPPISQMRGHPGFRNWAEDLLALGEEERMFPLRGTLNAIAESALVNNDALSYFLKSEAERIPFYVYLEASMTAQRTMTKNPCAAFVLSVISLIGWLEAGGEDVYRAKMHAPEIPYDVDGIYYDNPRLIPPERVRTFAGWDHIPYTCALISLKIGALAGARQIVEQCYDVFMAVSTTWNRSAGETLLRRYQELAKQIEDSYSWAISDLAEAFSEEGCHPDRPNFRPELGAILWTLGLVAESQIFSSTADPAIIPGKRFFQRLIRQSLDAIPYDSLLQYVWLELKDRPPFNLREHSALFTIINHVYGQFAGDEYPLGALFPLEPSRIYARTLIAWFGGTLERETIDGYLEMTAQLRQFSSLLDDRNFVRLRMDCLEHVLARESGLFTPLEPDEATIWRRLNQAAARMRKTMDLYPQIPEPQSRMGIPLFHLIENMFVHQPDASPFDTAAFERLLDDVETNRISKLSYWLQIAPALPAEDEQAKAVQLLAQEERLLTYLRGAYLLMHYGELPRYFDRYTLEFDEMQKVQADPEKFALTAENGRTQYLEREGELHALAAQLQDVAPDYARKRLQPQATLSDLLGALNSHCTLLEPPKSG